MSLFTTELRDDVKAKLRSDIMELLRSELRGAVKRQWKIFFGSNIPKNGPIYLHSYASDEDRLAMVDTTLFGKCDEGLLFTTEALFYRNGYAEPENVKWEHVRVPERDVYVQKKSRKIEHNMLPNFLGTSSENDVLEIGITYYNEFELRDLIRKICGLVHEAVAAGKVED